MPHKLQSTPCLGPCPGFTHRAEPIEPGDVISRTANQCPYYKVVALDGDWAWVRDANSGVYSTVFHPHFTRKGAVVAIDAARLELAA